MKTVFILLTSLMLAANCSGQIGRARTSKKVGTYLMKLQNYVRQYSLYADSIDWAELERKLDLASEGAMNLEDCRPAIDTIISTLRKAGDQHTVFLSREEGSHLKTAVAPDLQPEGKLLEGAIGYLRVPTFTSISLPASEIYAQRINDLIRQLDGSTTLRGWIIDLRGNRGGNISPMIRGLASFFSSAPCAFVIFPKQNLEMPLHALSGQAGRIQVRQSYKVKDIQTPVAILIDSNTGSSGEFTAIALRSLPRVRLFGSPSAGYTTSNTSFQLDDGAFLFLATGYMADFNKNTFIPCIVPDEVVAAGDAKEADRTIDAARNWLLTRQ